MPGRCNVVQRCQGGKQRVLRIKTQRLKGSELTPEANKERAQQEAIKQYVLNLDEGIVKTMFYRLDS